MSPGMTTSAEVRRRQRLVQSLLAMEFVGVPLIFLGLSLVVEVRNAEENDAGFDVIQVVPVLIMLAAGAFIWSRNRFKPARWAVRGAVFGAFGGFFVFGLIAIRSIGLDDPWFDGLTYVFPVAGVIGGGLCGLLGWAARRVLTRPVVEELADTRYELSFPVRDVKRVAVSVDEEKLHILETYSSGTGDNRRSRTRGERYALAQLTRVDEVHIDGYGGRVQPQLPPTIQAEVGASPGPALGVQAGRFYWVIPVEDAGQVARLIERRMRQSAGNPR